MSRLKYVYFLITLVTILCLLLTLSCNLTENSDSDSDSTLKNDNELPVIKINGLNPDTVAFESGDYQFSPVTAFDLVFDNDGVITDTIDLSNDVSKEGIVNTSEKGIYKIIYSVSDASDNNVKETLIVAVVDEGDVPDPDITKPTISISGNNPDTTLLGNKWNEPTVTALDNKDGNITSEIKKSGIVNITEVGKYEIIYSVSDASGNSCKDTLIVIVIDESIIDTKAPAIIIQGNNPDTITKGENWSLPSVSAVDNIDGDITKLISTSGTVDNGSVGIYEIIFSVEDKAGNSSAETLTVVVLDTPDNEAPVISISGDNPLVISMGATFTKPSATATDNKDGDISSAISSTGSVNTSSEGTYKIIYSVSDAAGNNVTDTLVVNVVFAYPIHVNIKASTFWCGEGASGDNDFITNTMSAWDTKWGEHFGLEDHPINISRDSDHIPVSTKYTGNENPYYCALPYNDYGSLVYDGAGTTIDNYETDVYGRKFDCYDNIHWGKDKSSSGWGYNYSLCKNRWIKVKVNGSDKVCYAQWEDGGPYYYNDYPYVFGNSNPANTTDSPYAGIDLSPSVCLFLDQELHDYGAGDFWVDWEFVDEEAVPDGPWKKHITTRQVSW